VKKRYTMEIEADTELVRLGVTGIDDPGEGFSLAVDREVFDRGAPAGPFGRLIRVEFFDVLGEFIEQSFAEVVRSDSD